MNISKYLLSGALSISLGIILTGCKSSDFSTKGSDTVEPQVDAPVGEGEAVGQPQSGVIAASGESALEEFVVQAIPSTTDIVFGVDTSGSMNEEIENIEQNMETFIRLLDDAKVDFQIKAIGNDFDFPEDPRLTAFDDQIDSNDAISVLNSFFVDPVNLRPQTPLNVIIVSDDNGEGDGNLANDFAAPASASSVRVHAIVGLVEGEDPNNPDCDIAAVGTEHQTLAKQTKGLIQNICVNDWSKIVADLSASIIATTVTSFPLTNPVNAEMEIKVTVNGAVLLPETDGAANYTINVEENTISIAAAANLKKDDLIAVTYYVL